MMSDTEGNGVTEASVIKKEFRSKPGIIYFSSIPPYMRPNKIRNIMAQYGEIGKVFLQPEETDIRKKRKMGGGSGEFHFSIWSFDCAA